MHLKTFYIQKNRLKPFVLTKKKAAIKAESLDILTKHLKFSYL